MNDISEENKNQKMNTETLEKHGTNLSELTGQETMEELLGIYESSLKKFEEGQVVTGTVISVGRNMVLVDVGYKSEGQISIREFIDEDGNIKVKVGDKFEVMIEVWDEEEETVLLSHEKAKKVKVWDAIKDIYDADGTIEGVITSRVKGGFSVDIGLLGFLPGSQADLRPIRNMDEMVNKTYTFKILKYNKKRNNIVLSRRVLLETERDALRTTTLDSIAEGSVMEGIVKNITEYGVFVDLGGVDGLLHITDISWGRVKHPSELFSVGDKINVKILSFDIEKERVSLGMKQLTPDPWTTAVDKFPVDSKVVGKVVSLTDYGAFIELEEGVEGLIHVSEMSWTRKIRHPSQMVTVGEEVEAVVLDLKPENRRISLGIKQTVDNPWEVISQKYPVGTIIEGKIKNITEFGLFIGIDDDIDGLVHISDISWTKRIKHPSEVYKKNDTIQAVVLDIDKANERFSLGIKQTQADPWESVAQRYEVGKEISGVITNLTDFGVFVELEEGIEGLVHVSEISKENIKSPKEHYQIGDTITAKVMNINSDERRIGLSIKRLLDEEDDSKYLEEFAKNMKPATSSFGEILRNNIQEQIEAKKVQGNQTDTADAESKNE
ncbi:MAG: 30S ribosomal protein S1 [Proteobacteria bacterium]|nr:30S ribosomal protein S1 [Pseudomonadota bacterium]MBU1389174.1 30S ribosomal protein S1 [Pseudomonadota bacterium]MBU1543398.1 30S ribosomal protein S1 [Pseudomonadota bacterium]